MFCRKQDILRGLMGLMVWSMNTVELVLLIRNSIDYDKNYGKIIFIFQNILEIQIEVCKG
jgi:hypothetical protein